MLKIDSRFFDGKEIAELCGKMEPTNHQKASIILCFIRLLFLCADGVSFTDCKKLSLRTEATKKAAEVVWDHCVEAGILRDDGQGFSAIDWLREKGIISEEKKKGESEFERIMIDPQKEFHLSEGQIESLGKKYKTELNLRIAYHQLWNWAIYQGIDPRKINAYKSLSGWVYDRVMMDDSFPREWFLRELKNIYGEESI